MIKMMNGQIGTLEQEAALVAAIAELRREYADLQEGIAAWLDVARMERAEARRAGVRPRSLQTRYTMRDQRRMAEIRAEFERLGISLEVAQ